MYINIVIATHQLWCRHFTLTWLLPFYNYSLYNCICFFYLFIYSPRNTTTMATEEQMDAFKEELNVLRQEMKTNYQAHDDHSKNDAHNGQNCRSCRLYFWRANKIVQKLLELAYQYDIQEICCICQEEYSAQTVAYTIPCFHAYHKDCFQQMYRNRTKPSMRCPLCTMKIHDEGIQITSGKTFKKNTICHCSRMNDN